MSDRGNRAAPVTIRRQGDLAWVTIDNPPVNATSAAVRQGLAEAVRQVADMPVRAAVLRCAGRTFVAGGDITEFDAPPVQPDLPDVIQAIEDCPVPWIAAMHGSVFGGGLEIALGCAWRVAAPGTRFALPEVLLGLVPGAGGTQRLPRLVGPALALDMAASGAPVPAEAFRAAGGLDAILPGLEDDSGPGLRAFLDALGPRPPATRLRPFEAPDAHWWAAQEAELAADPSGRTAPLANLRLVRRAGEVPFETGQKEERACHLSLRDSDESLALRHMFFAERRAARPPTRDGAARLRLRRVRILGVSAFADGLCARAEAAGLAVARSAEAGEPADLCLVAEAGCAQDEDGAPRVHVAPIVPERSDPAEGPGHTDAAGVRLALGSDPDEGGGLVEIAIPRAASNGVSDPAAVAALAFAKRLEGVPVLTTPVEGFVVSTLLEALNRLAPGQGAAALTAFNGASPGDLNPRAQRALAVLANAGALAIERGCVPGPGSIDVIAVAGCGFPRRLGGPMYLADRIGMAEVADWMELAMSERPGPWTVSDRLRNAAA